MKMQRTQTNLADVIFILWICCCGYNAEGPYDTVQRHHCRAPDIMIKSDGGVNTTNDAIDFKGILEVQFMGIFSPFQQRRICKIKCVNGKWLGPLCSFEEDGGRFQPMLKSCDLEQPPPNVQLFHNGKAFWPDSRLRFAHGTLLNARCTTLGLYKFVGNATIRCRNGHWEKRMPSCLSTTYFTNFSGLVPPTILYRTASGSAAPSDTGDLLVYPGSILHLDCLYRRRDGNPQWTWTPNSRQYPTGWAVARPERESRYRLSIYYTKPQDSGTFTCATPRGLTNSISIIVKTIECPNLKVELSTTRIVVEGYRINDKVRFSCLDGHLLIGVTEATCLWTGQWSDVPPVCEALLCSELVPTDPKLQIVSRNNTHRGRARFTCPKGHRLEGPSEIICLNGTWSDIVPTCIAVYCPEPSTVSHGHLVGPQKAMVGDMMQTICKDGHVLVGDEFVSCIGLGMWDQPFPTCKAACLLGSVPENGGVSPVQDHYDVGQSITVNCNNEYIIHGAQKIQCIQAGKWSHSLPECKLFRFE